MSVLSAQSIRRLCINPHLNYSFFNPLITPFAERGVINGKSYGLSVCTYDVRIAESLILSPGSVSLASTMERFYFPNNVCGSVLDKSSYSRVFVSAFNTHLDPGWRGVLTVELVNHGAKEVIWRPGEPLCQIKFEWLDEPTQSPYRGKYQDQETGPQGPRHE